MDNFDKRLFEEQRKRLLSLCEFTIVGDTVKEAGEEPAPDASQQGGDAPMPPMDGGAGAPGGDMGGGMPQDGGQGMPQGGMPQDGGQGMPQDASQQQAPQGFNPQDGGDMNGGNAGMDPSMDANADPSMDAGMDPTMQAGDVPTEDDDVVDITDLTDAQEETEEKIDGMDDKFSAIIKQIKSFKSAIEDSDAKIADLKREIEKRNPTPIEKMSMRSMKSEPYNLSVDKFWDKKQAESNYSIEDDNNGKGDEQYAITNGDLNGANDWQGIARSFDDDDFIYNQTLNGVLGY